jgi:alpha-glucosidase
MDEYEKRAAIGETVFGDPKQLVPYYGENLDGLHVPFNFTLMPLLWEEPAFRSAIQRYYAALPDGAWPNFVLGSHDEHRLATRLGAKNTRTAQMLLLTLWGTPTLYYGDEIGMQDGVIPPDKEQDPWGLRVPGHSRDPERTPMQWDDSANAGFTVEGVEPWLPVAENYTEVNVAAQSKDPHSQLNFTRALLALRRELPTLHRGDITFIDNLPEDVMAYTREWQGQKVLVVLNFGGRNEIVSLGKVAREGQILLDTNMRSSGTIRLRAVMLIEHEGIIFKID